MTTEKIHQGKAAKNYLKGKGWAMGDVALKLDMTDQGLSKNLRNEELPKTFILKLNHALDIDILKEIGIEPDRPPKKVPVLGEAAAGTDMEMTYHDNPHDVQYIDVGDLLRDSEAAFTVYGNSMTPNYPSGCVLGIKANLDGFIQPGEIYLLETKSNRLFKRLFYNDDKTGYICYSDNTQQFADGDLKGKAYYPAFEISKKDVIRLFDVTGMIKRTRNSGIINRQK